MHGMAAILTEGLVSQAESADLEREFERRLADSGALAFRVAYGVLRQRQDAEDVAQEALVRAYRKRCSLRDRERFRSWLVRICWRLALDHRRAGKRRERRELAAAEPEPAPDAEQVAAANEFRERLGNAIDALSEKLRVVSCWRGSRATTWPRWPRCWRCPRAR